MSQNLHVELLRDAAASSDVDYLFRTCRYVLTAGPTRRPPIPGDPPVAWKHAAQVLAAHQPPLLQMFLRWLVLDTGVSGNIDPDPLSASRAKPAAQRLLWAAGIELPLAPARDSPAIDSRYMDHLILRACLAEHPPPSSVKLVHDRVSAPRHVLRALDASLIPTPSSVSTTFVFDRASASVECLRLRAYPGRVDLEEDDYDAEQESARHASPLPDGLADMVDWAVDAHILVRWTPRTEQRRRARGLFIPGRPRE